MIKSKKFEKRQREVVDKLILAVAIIEPFFTLPQAYAIFKTQNASGVSILTWMGFNIMTAIWVWYAVNRKDKVVLIYQGLFLIFNTIVIIGALMYGGQWL